MEAGVDQVQLEIRKADLDCQDIDFTFFLNTRQGDIFNPSPPGPKVITQDAINQVGKLLMAKVTEIFLSFEQVLQFCNYLMKSTYFMVAWAERPQLKPRIVEAGSATVHGIFNHKASCGERVDPRRCKHTQLRSTKYLALTGACLLRSKKKQCLNRSLLLKNHDLIHVLLPERLFNKRQVACKINKGKPPPMT